METAFDRPRVADLAFRLFDRPVHPEFFSVLATRRVDRDGGRITAHVTRTGHVLVWTAGESTLTEAIVTADQELPETGVRVGHRFVGSRSGRCELPGGVRYQASTHVETLPPEQFLHVHEELREDGRRKGLICHFRPHHRLGLSPLGVVIAEALRGGLAVNTFHTFPDELAVVKTQSLIERA